MGCEPSITTEQNKLSSYPRFSQMRFDALLILFRQTANDFRNALALARSGQLMRAIDWRCLRHRRTLGQGVCENDFLNVAADELWIEKEQ